MTNSKTKETCKWCMSTQHIKRKISKYMPKEYEYRCSACHETFWEENNICDKCDLVFESINIQYDSKNDEYYCNYCKNI